MGETKRSELISMWLSGEVEDAEDVFDYVIDLGSLYDFAPKTPQTEEDVEKLLNGVKAIVDVFGYRVKDVVTVATDATVIKEYVVELKKELEKLNTCKDILLVKEYDMYILCLEPKA